jgi:hypothetical protein
MASDFDKPIDICLRIEIGLKNQYQTNPLLNDSACIIALDNARIAVKHHFGYAKNERFVATALMTGVIDWCVAVADEQIGKLIA